MTTVLLVPSGLMSELERSNLQLRLEDAVVVLVHREINERVEMISVPNHPTWPAGQISKGLR